MHILKRFAILGLALALALSLCFAFAGCNEKDTPNSTGESSETEDEEQTGNPSDDSGESSETEDEEQIRETYLEVYGKISDLLMDTALGSMTANSAPNSEPAVRNLTDRGAVLFTSLYTAEDEIYTDAVTNSTWFIGATTYVYLASELYKIDSFTVTDSPVGYTVTPESNGTDSHVDIVMMSNMNAKTGEVLLQLEFETTEYTNGVLTHSEENYIYIDADYDFGQKEVETLLIHIWSIDQSDLILSAKYSNETFKHMDETHTQEVTETVTALRTAYESKFDEKVQLGDFTAEYERANEYMMQKINEMLGR